MRRISLGRLLVTLVAAAAATGAAPAPPSYHAVERTIAKIRGGWTEPSEAKPPHAAGWNAIFDTTLAELRAYSTANTDDDRLAALNRLHEISTALAAVGWNPAAELRESLRAWLRPRVRLAWAQRRLLDQLHTLPAAATPEIDAFRTQWTQFVENDLGKSLRDFDGAATIAQRAGGLKAIYAALAVLQTRNQQTPWGPSFDLQAAVNDLFNQPNLDVSIDKNSLAPTFEVNLITTGPVYRKGYWSQVTAGPKLGFGLVPTDDGIAFFNRQMLTSVTPITDFQKQIENNQQGQRAAKMYEFKATQSDTAVLTIMVVIRTGGMTITPSYSHNVNADIGTTPQERGAARRAIASLMGFDQTAITQKAWQEAIPRIRTNVVKEAQEEAEQRTAREAAEKNIQLAQYLIGGDRAVYRDFVVDGLSFRTRAENALIGGRFLYRNGPGRVGAFEPQPPALARPDGGISADLHLISILTNFAHGYLQSDAARAVDHLMIVTKNVAPGTASSEAVQVTRNADYSTFLAAVKAAQAANDPKVVALRVKRPMSGPDFGVDAKGHLVALVNDLQIEVPLPQQAGAAAGALPPGKVLRIVAPHAEFTLSFEVQPESGDEPVHVKGKIESFDPGPNAKIFALDDDEAQPKPVNTFASLGVLVGLRAKLKDQPINFPLRNIRIPGVVLQEVSLLDPSGWIRVNLIRAATTPALSLP